jgi:hypothetical protein
MTQTSQNILPFAEVYIDESSQSNHRYLVLGAIILDSADANDTNAALQTARLPELPNGTMKWTKVSAAKLAAYKRAVDVFFETQKRTTLDFHSLIVDTTKQKHRLYNQGSREIGFNKELFQLALKCGRLYNCLLHIYPDRRSTNQRTETLRTMLNFKLRKDGDKRDWPYRRVQFRDPEDSQVLQMADVFAGAIASCHNDPDGRVAPPKFELRNYILRKAGIRNPLVDTARRGRFTVWHRQLK